MQHVGTGHVGDHLDGTLSHSVLIVCANATETDGLTKLIAMDMKVSRDEHTTIGVIMFNRDPNVSGFVLKEQFPTNCISWQFKYKNLLQWST